MVDDWHRFLLVMVATILVSVVVTGLDIVFVQSPRQKGAVVVALLIVSPAFLGYCARSMLADTKPMMTRYWGRLGAISKELTGERIGISNLPSD